MALRICIYEDDKQKDFDPITALRPVYLMRPGILPLFERARISFPDAKISLAARNQLSATVSGASREYPVNILKREDGDVLFINGRIRDYGNLATLVNNTPIGTRFMNNGDVVAVLFPEDLAKEMPSISTPEQFHDKYNAIASTFADFDTTASLYNRTWELVADLENKIAADFKYIRPALTSDISLVSNQSILLNQDNFIIGDGVTVAPGSLIDASKGPIFIGANTKIESQVAIYGPTFIGANSVIVAGKIEASSIGHTCRVGGEVEESIFQSYVNKYHAGFIGHSYVGSWVNFGAMTTNSDLKNNYSNIRVSVNSEVIDTGMIKVGSFIGDYTKFGIGTLLNTGINIGVCCNVFGGGLVVDKEIPPFSWGGTDNWSRYNLTKAIETARRTCGRRNVTLTANEEDLIQHVSQDHISEEGVLTFGQTKIS